MIVSLVGLYAAPKLVERSLFRPYWFLRERQYATLITSGLVHADLPHLLFNMMTFWFFAFQLEGRIGSIPFASAVPARPHCSASPIHIKTSQ